MTNVCACVPKTCAQLGHDCGLADDGCGTMIDCGACPAGGVCGGPGACGAGQPNVCSNATCCPKTCAQLGYICGPLDDGCGHMLDCGTCPFNQQCGGTCGDQPGHCGFPGCCPTNCKALGINCGAVGDGCGNLLQCGTCPMGETCGAGGMPNVCG
jgi:hypothetical protein